MPATIPMACPRHLSLEEALKGNLDSHPWASEGTYGFRKAVRDDSRTDLTHDGQLCALSCPTQQFSCGLCHTPFPMTYLGLSWGRTPRITQAHPRSVLELSGTVPLALPGSRTHLGIPVHAFGYPQSATVAHIQALTYHGWATEGTEEYGGGFV